jgi:hypothetical protein
MSRNLILISSWLVVAAACGPRMQEPCGPNSTAVAGACQCDVGFALEAAGCVAIAGGGGGGGEAAGGGTGGGSAVDAGIDAGVVDAGMADAGVVDADGCGPNGYSHCHGSDCHCDCDPGYIDNQMLQCVLPPPCEGAEDAYEPNDEPGHATPWDAGIASVALRACPANRDWYRFDLTAGQTLTVELTFTHSSRSDLDMYLYARQGNSLANVAAFTGATELAPERIVHTAAATGEYFLWVEGFEGGQAPYTLSATW